MPEQQNIEYKQSWHDDYLKIVAQVTDMSCTIDSISHDSKCVFENLAIKMGSITDLRKSTPENNTKKLALNLGVITTQLQEEFGISSEKFGKEIGKGSEKEIPTWIFVLELIVIYPKITAVEIANIIGISSRATEKHIKKLKDKVIVERIGGRKEGFWKIIKQV